MRKQMIGLLLVLAFTAFQAAAKETFVAARQTIGSKNAQGALIWLHGWCPGWQNCSSMGTPAHIARFSDARWDVYRLNVPPSRANHDSVGWYARARFHAKLVLPRVKELREAGYRRVALAGYSGGAMSVLFAGTMTADIDAVIAIAPCCGTAKSGPYIAVEGFYDLLEDLEVSKVMIVFFSGERNAPDNIGFRSKKILKSKPLMYVMHDRPEGFYGHTAGLGFSFADCFSKEMINFATGSNIATDEVVVSWEGLFEAVTVGAKFVHSAPERRIFKVELPGGVGSCTATLPRRSAGKWTLDCDNGGLVSGSVYSPDARTFRGRDKNRRRVTVILKY